MTDNRIIKPNYSQSFNAGKLPPQALDIEESVLGCLMVIDCIDEVILILKPESFYKEVNQFIFKSILDLKSKNAPIDMLTVCEQLRSNGSLDICGGPFAISQLTDKGIGVSSIEYNARIIAQKFMQREIIRIASESIADAYDETTDVFETIENLEKQIFELNSTIETGCDETMIDLENEVIEHIKKSGDKTLSGVDTGFSSLNKIFGGWQNSDLVIVAARPGMGKTALVTCCALNVAETVNIAFFSLEMSRLQLGKRIMSALTDLELYKLNNGLERYEWEQLNAKAKKFSSLKMNIYDKIFTLKGIEVKAKKLKRQNKLDVIYIDYLQLIGHKLTGRSKENEVSEVSRALKILAKELNVPIIVLSQLSRGVETRGGDKRPQLSDLRDSGAIEQDADIVMFVWRPEYYGMKEIMENDVPISTEGKAYGLIQKHRNGALEDVELKFVGRLAKFMEKDECKPKIVVSMNNPDSWIMPKSKDFDIVKEDNDLPF